MAPGEGAEASGADLVDPWSVVELAELDGERDAEGDGGEEQRGGEEARGNFRHGVHSSWGMPAPEGTGHGWR